MLSLYSVLWISLRALSGDRCSVAQSQRHHHILTIFIKLAARVLQLSAYFKSRMVALLGNAPNTPVILPPERVALTQFPSTSTFVSQIVPLLTPHPRALSQYLREHFGILARPITHPTVPKGEGRVRVCVHANNTEEEIDHLLNGVIAWIQSFGQQGSANGGEMVARGPKARL